MARSRAARIALGVLRWTLAVVLGLVILVIAAVVALLYSNAAFAWAAGAALEAYNERIPGAITIDRIEGRLADDLRLVGVVARDRAGRRLVAVDALALRWDAWALVRGVIDVASLTVAGPRLYLVEGTGFADLAPPGPPEPEPPSETLLPAMPLDLSIDALRLAGGAIVGAEGEALARGVDLEARDLHWAGLEAGLRITGGGAVVPEVTTIASLTATARWSEPTVGLQATIVTDLGRASIASDALDLDAWSGAVTLAVDARAAALRGRLGEALGGRLRALAGDPSLRLLAELDDGRAEVGVVARAPGLAALSLAAALPVEAPQDLVLGGHARVHAPALLGPEAAPLGVLKPVFLASSEGDAWDDLRARLRLEIDALGGLVVRARADLDDEGERLALALALAGAGIDLDAGAVLDLAAPALTRARWRLRVPDLATPAAIAGRFTAVPALAGELRTRGTCAGEAPSCEGTLTLRGFAGAGVELAELTARLSGRPLADAPVARVDLAARDLRAPPLELAEVEARATLGPGLTQGTGPLIARLDLRAGSPGRRGGDRIALDAAARLGEPLAVDLRALSFRIAELDAHLRGPARITAVGRRITVRDLDLALAGGAVAAAGTLDLAGRSDLRVDVEGVRLRALRALLPDLRPAGVVDAHARLRGPATAPTIDAWVTAERLALRGAVLGDLDVAGTLHDGQATAQLDLRGPRLRGALIEALAPLRVDLAAGEVTIPRGRLAVQATVERLDLAALRDFAPDAPALAGVVDLSAALEGPAARPQAALALHARRLEVADQPIGEVLVRTVAAAGGGLEGELTASRRGGHLRVDARALPLTLDLTRGGLTLRPEGEVDVLVTAEGIDLRRQLAGLVDDREAVAGVVALRGWIHGPIRGPQLALGLAGVDLEARGVELGDLRLQLAHRGGLTRADLAVDGGLVDALTLHAEVPLRLRPLAADFTWLKDQEHRVTLAVDALDLVALGPLGVLPALAGVVDVDAQLRGSAGDPTIGLTARAQRLAWRERRIGDAEAELGYAGGRARLGAVAGLASKTSLEAHAEAPLALDLAAGDARWIDGERGALTLAIKRLDPEALAIAGPVPESLLLDADVDLKASGTPRAFAAALAADGTFGHVEVGPLPLHLAAEASERRQHLELALGRGEGSLAADLRARADVRALAEGRASADAIPIEARVKAEKIDLRTFEAALPEAIFDLAGALRADLRADGTLGAPALHGVVALDDGAVTVIPLQQRLTAIDVELRARGRRFALDRLDAASGPGRLRGHGTLDLAADGGLAARGEVVLRDFPFVRPGLPQMQIDTRVEARARSTARATALTIEVADTEVTITGVNTPAPLPIPESDAVTFRDERERVSVAVDTAPPAAAVAADTAAVADDEAPEELPPRFTLTVAVDEPVVIEGPATMMRWDGKVVAVTQGDQREVRGELAAHGGHIDLLGNRFAIETGSVTLPEDEDTIDPYLNLVARAPTSAGLVTATFRGRLSAPELVLSSDPAMSQSAILTLLVTGSADASQADEGKVLAQAASLLASFQNPALSQYLDRKLGIDRIGLGFGEGITQPILTVGKRITSDLYVETALRVNAPRQQNRVEVRVEYEFLPHWSLETFFGDAAVGGLDVFWRRVFGDPDVVMGAH